jgi:membrane protein required for colicin V production
MSDTQAAASRTADDAHDVAHDVGNVARAAGNDATHAMTGVVSQSWGALQSWTSRLTQPASSTQAASAVGRAQTAPSHYASTASTSWPASDVDTMPAEPGAVLTAFDYVVIAIVVLSALRGAWRGLVSELFALVGWVVAFIVAARFADKAAVYVPANWPGGALTQWLVGFIVIATAVLVVSTVGSALLSRLTEIGGLRSVDRGLGLMFGLARGVVIVVVLFAAAKFTELPKTAFWRHAMLRPYVVQTVTVLAPLLPVQISGLLTR